MSILDVHQVHELGSKTPEFMVRDGVGFWSEEQLECWVSARTDVLLVARVGERVVGFILTTLHAPTGKATWENLYVRTEYRGTGVGTVLIKEMFRKLRIHGAKHICFMVRTSNVREEVVQYYGAHGFQRGHDFTWFDMSISL